MRKTQFVLLFCILTLVGYNQTISETDKTVFCYFENRPHNFIVIPNFRGNLHHFKIYRKLKTDTAYTYILELKKPAIPLRSNKPGVYSVSWEDLDYHSREVDYKILYYTKNEKETGEMEIVWERIK